MSQLSCLNSLAYFSRRAICNIYVTQWRTFSKSDYFDDPGAPRVALCKDNQTIAMYHPKEALDYEKTIAIPRDDPRYSSASVEALVSNRLHEMDVAHRPVENPNLTHKFPMNDRDVVPTVMELSTLFHTSKHRWFRRSGRTKYFEKVFKIPD